MATPTYDPIASTTLTSSASSVTFSSIPQTYRDLVLVIRGALTGGAVVGFQFNSDTGSNYSNVSALGDGSSASSFSGTTTGAYMENVWFTDFEQMAILNVMDYSQTNKHKSCLSRNSGYIQRVSMNAHRWANTSAITTLTVVNAGQSFVAGSTFSLYGIVA